MELILATTPNRMIQPHNVTGPTRVVLDVPRYLPGELDQEEAALMRTHPAATVAGQKAR